MVFLCGVPRYKMYALLASMAHVFTIPMRDIALNFVTGYTIEMNYLSWAKLILGVWVFVSPWVLGFSGYAFALWSNVIAGACIVVLTLWGLFGKGLEGGIKK
ncbi:MAG: hypothetical protein UX58_C0007G0054 [Candidatus Wolfebacteria bacterium GW2011_GWB2_46_69]|nr:MAG: hypothetical protein UX58_C0007G0054 [Candidatus Wolfebacteria bacterium GW2011_GWB2_46_69]KKU65894.1 MAG: hypothetical protein UX90_C0002G0270 [Candidatus Wolfebacteria bacterium GW2011_GWD2_47_17]